MRRLKKETGAKYPQVDPDMTITTADGFSMGSTSVGLLAYLKMGAGDTVTL